MWVPLLADGSEVCRGHRASLLTLSKLCIEPVSVAVTRVLPDVVAQPSECTIDIAINQRDHTAPNEVSRWVGLDVNDTLHGPPSLSCVPRRDLRVREREPCEGRLRLQDGGHRRLLYRRLVSAGQPQAVHGRIDLAGIDEVADGQATQAICSDLHLAFASLNSEPAW